MGWWLGKTTIGSRLFGVGPKNKAATAESDELETHSTCETNDD